MSDASWWKILVAAGVGAICGFCLARRSPRGDTVDAEGDGCGASHAASTMKERTGGGKAMRREATNGRREVICEDALKWIEKQGHFPSGSMVFTSLPDMSEVVEFAPRFEDWENFFMKAVRHILTALPYGSVAVFYQTDVRLPTEGQVSKAFLVLKAAEEIPEVRLKWHKIVHFGTVDQPTWNSVQFTHLLCFARGENVPRVGVQLQRNDESGTRDEVVDLGSTIPDVLERGDKPKGLRKGACCMGVSATAAVLKWATRRLAGLHTVIDPFCGAGTVLAMANAFGLDAIGVDISPKRIKQAQRLDSKDLMPMPMPGQPGKATVHAQPR